MSLKRVGLAAIGLGIVLTVSKYNSTTTYQEDLNNDGRIDKYIRNNTTEEYRLKLQKQDGTYIMIDNVDKKNIEKLNNLNIDNISKDSLENLLQYHN